MNDEMYTLLGHKLSLDEQVLWNGKPNSLNLFTLTDFIIIPLSLAWLIFIFLWETIAILSIHESGSLGIVFSILGIPFIIIGLYLLIGRYIYKYIIAKKTYYFLTNKRVIEIIDFWSKRFKYMYLKDIKSISITINRKGIGTIFLGDIPYLARLLLGASILFSELSTNKDKNFIVFKNIDNAEQVYEILNNSTIS